MREMRVFCPPNTAALVVDFAPDPVGRAGEDQAVGVLGGTFGAEDGRVEAEDGGGCGRDGGLVGHVRWWVLRMLVGVVNGFIV